MAFQTPQATSRSVTGIPTGRLAIWWVLASEIVIFGGLVTCYLLLRLHHVEWAEEASHTSTPAGAFNTFVLLTSSLFVVLAHRAVTEGNREKAFKFLWYTIAMGGVFLGVKAYEYTTEIVHGYTLTSSVFWSFYYTATGLHGLHVIAGMVIMGIISFSVRKGENLQRVEYIGIYWHFVDVVWIFLFPLFYIAK
ncbi:MAG: cytochrome oxidase subunit III [Roseibacillus sp.]|jgi:heme/copper-type cytochrome/quinol oxidase subunit 3|nr:cytochrome oxidase subunit III [Roseibacillus sp.]MBP34508.1 cytochrome oxidase subunit III [Roseibacillus sp.]MCP4729157.1 cytochrome oxidase subunit III [Roseibacillus sp.]MDP7307670.1 cytochrome c oxidase subunit 3 [Roseibacillus sp.]MDP7656589.1 cytochrome c oxidase subunit 3 [Roseibacillus sp.]|tara:strand:- start:7306 stop:7884 length:579 start_codon:yes stop_codon:yes gene_type:complete